jgi:hypothetical protein
MRQVKKLNRISEETSLNHISKEEREGILKLRRKFFDVHILIAIAKQVFKKGFNRQKSCQRQENCV